MQAVEPGKIVDLRKSDPASADSLVEESGLGKPQGFLRTIASTAKRVHASAKTAHTLFEKHLDGALTKHRTAIENAPEALERAWIAGIERHKESVKKSPQAIRQGADRAVNTTLAEATSASIEALKQGFANRKEAAEQAVQQVRETFEEVAHSVVEEVKAETKIGLETIRASQSYRAALKDAQKLLDQGVAGAEELTASQRDQLSSIAGQDLAEIKETVRARYEQLLIDNSNPEVFTRKEIRARLSEMLDQGPSAVAALAHNIENSKVTLEKHNQAADVGEVYSFNPSNSATGTQIIAAQESFALLRQVEPTPVSFADENVETINVSGTQGDDELESVLPEQPLLAPARVERRIDDAKPVLHSNPIELTVYQGGLLERSINADLRTEMLERQGVEQKKESVLPDAEQPVEEAVELKVHQGGKQSGTDVESGGEKLSEHPPVVSLVVDDADRIKASLRGQNVTKLRKIAKLLADKNITNIQGRTRMGKEKLVEQLVGNEQVIKYVGENESKIFSATQTQNIKRAAAQINDGSKTKTIK